MGVRFYNDNVDSGYHSNVRFTAEQEPQLSDVLNRAADFFYSSVTVEGDVLDSVAANTIIIILR